MRQKGVPARLITSRDNPQIVRIRRLHQRQARDQTGLFLAEGVRFVLKAVEHGARIETLVVAPNLLSSPLGRDLSRRLRRNGVPCLDVIPDVFFSLTRAQEPQGLAAVVRQRWERLDRANPDTGLCWVALDAVRTPGNLGTIIRTCDAVGAAGVITLGEGVDPHDPAAVRATMGGLFAQRIVRAAPHELSAWVRRNGALVVGTSPTASMSYHAVRYDTPIVLLMGGERSGLSPEMQGRCDLVVSIPMVGGGDSLNLAVATGVMLYELFHQRHGAPDLVAPVAARSP